MKRMITIVLTLILGLYALAACAVAEGTPQGEPPQINQRCGLLTMLNIGEEEYAAFKDARLLIGDQLIREGYAEQGEHMAPPEGDKPLPPPGEGPAPEGGEQLPPPGEGPAPEGGEQLPPPGEGPAPEDAKPIIVYYDTLDAMLMALKAGDIGSMEIYQSVGRYLCATNDNLRLGMSYDLSKERNAFAQEVFSTILGNDFAFLILEGNAELRDQFNEAIASMKADGTLDRLVQEQIEEVIAGGEAAPITMPVTDGARTIRVAVTGSLPPMDYVAADGTPAGFNTAVLAEIASRAGFNIEMVVVDSIGRAAALASGTVDAVFWTRTSVEDKRIHSLSEEDVQAWEKEHRAGLSEEENEIYAKVTALCREIAASTNYGIADMPEGTIATDAYYSDVFIPVELK